MYLGSLRCWAAIVLLLGGIVYSWALYSVPPSGDKAYFSIASVQPHQTPFQRGYLYKGMAYVNRQRIPCSVYCADEERPKANCDYVLVGKLHKRGAYDYAFKAKEWFPIARTYSLAEFRYQAKEWFRQFLDAQLQRPRTATFLSSLITGDVEDRSLRFEFSRLGLQHILAISGFHFAILIAFCSFFLSFFLSYRSRLIALLLAVNLYFVFIGSLPAVQRSWLTAVLYLVGKLIGRHSSGLNLLGVALAVEIILDPLVSAHLGFQLSFLSCTGILLFQPLFERPLRRFFPKRTTLEWGHFTLLSQHGYLISSFLRQALAVALAVNLAILPLLLYHFHQFPLLSLLYNLFFPLLVSASLFLLLISLLVYLACPPLAVYFFKATDFFTSQLLNLTAYPPLALNYTLKVPAFPAWLIPLYLFTIFYISTTYKKYIEDKYITIVK